MWAAEQTFMVQKGDADLAYSSNGTITLRQREKVVLFICEACEDFGLCGRTSWSAINLFDRFLCESAAANCYVRRTEVEMLSLVCVLIASKFLERKTPALGDLGAMCGHPLAVFKEAELSVLKRLRWQLHLPAPHVYLCKLLPILPEELRSMLRVHAEFFVDLSSFEPRCMHTSFAVSAIAGLACAISRVNLRDEELDKALRHICRLCSVEEEEVRECATMMLGCYEHFVQTHDKPRESIFRPVDTDDTDEEGRDSPNSVIGTGPTMGFGTSAAHARVKAPPAPPRPFSAASSPSASSHAGLPGPPANSCPLDGPVGFERCEEHLHF